ncbi:MAG: hypothetical protein PHW96_00345 [Candidatus Nanoarchaeia archaeon]|nr:hypothetical protein [Candidatus Nanoarchaeia archaeon]
MIKASKVVFISDELEGYFNSLSDEEPLKKAIVKAIKNLNYNAFSGIQIPKKLIPKDYVQNYKINNLWKLNLINGWRLLYTVTADNKVELISAILEWFSHKEYERKLKYK